MQTSNFKFDCGTSSSIHSPRTLILYNRRIRRDIIPFTRPLGRRVKLFCEGIIFQLIQGLCKFHQLNLPILPIRPLLCNLRIPLQQHLTLLFGVPAV